MVKCQNFGDKCDWTDELRQALEHETKCCKGKTTLNNPFEEEFKQLINRMTELEVKVKVHERNLVEKESQNINQNKQIADQKNQVLKQKIQIESLQKGQTNSISHQLSSNQTPLSMTIPNIEDESNYSPMFTAFQWKFNPTDVKSGVIKISPPFYNGMNAYCFQLDAQFVRNNFCISLCCYRGKYDDNVKEIKTSKNFDFQIHIFGKNVKLKIF